MSPDPDMVASLSAARLDPSAPQPSVESLLHAILPHRAVLHSHADVIVTSRTSPTARHGSGRPSATTS